MTRDEALGVLGLESNATLEDAKKAYRALAKAIHPDNNPSPGAEQLFMLVEDAYKVIAHIEQKVRDEQAMARAEKARRERARAEREAKAQAERERREREHEEKERAERERQKKRIRSSKVVKPMPVSIMIGAWNMSSQENTPTPSKTSMLQLD